MLQVDPCSLGTYLKCSRVYWLHIPLGLPLEHGTGESAAITTLLDHLYSRKLELPAYLVPVL